ncbi:hypothetical protein B0G76_4578 [Paraburkholderia sp. BL23I1N1]|nr:hypothetical protein B0G76_4578 [Paraburkholderia sp. BL23I1N1]
MRLPGFRAGYSEAALHNRPLLAGLRQYHRQFARRKPAIQRGRTRPWLFKSDGDLDRRLVADCRPMCVAATGTWSSRARRSEFGRVEMWRGSGRLGLSVTASFVWRCPNTLAVTPFPHPAHRTQRADLPHWALGQDITPSHTPGYAPTCAQTYETEVPVEMRGWISPAPATSELVLVA